MRKGSHHSQEAIQKNKESHPKGKCFNTGRTHFKKGYIPKNKGIKGYYHSGSFKKGHIPLGNFFKKGILHPNWKGGKSKRKHPFDKRYKKWRIAVFARDNFTCLICRKVGGYLEAHHIKSWADYSRLRYKINNGITLCRECHKLI